MSKRLRASLNPSALHGARGELVRSIADKLDNGGADQFTKNKVLAGLVQAAVASFKGSIGNGPRTGQSNNPVSRPNKAVRNVPPANHTRPSLPSEGALTLRGDAQYASNAPTKTRSYELTDKVSLHPPDAAWHAFMANPTAYAAAPEPPAVTGRIMKAISMRKHGRLDDTLTTSQTQRLSFNPWIDGRAIHSIKVTTASAVDVSAGLNPSTTDNMAHGGFSPNHVSFESGHPDDFIGAAVGGAYHNFCGAELRVRVDVFGDDSEATVYVHDPIENGQQGLGFYTASTQDVLEHGIESHEQTNTADYSGVKVIGGITRVPGVRVHENTPEKVFIVRVPPRFVWRTLNNSSSGHECYAVGNFFADLLDDMPFIEVVNSGSRSISIQVHSTVFYYTCPQNVTNLASTIAKPLPNYVPPALIRFSATSGRGANVTDARVNAAIKVYSQPHAEFTGQSHIHEAILNSVKKGSDHAPTTAIVTVPNHDTIDGEQKVTLKSIGLNTLNGVSQAGVSFLNRMAEAAGDRLDPFQGAKSVFKSIKGLWGG